MHIQTNIELIEAMIKDINYIGKYENNTKAINVLTNCEYALIQAIYCLKKYHRIKEKK